MKKNFFKNPIYVTRPTLPNIDFVNAKLKEIWDSKQVTNIGKQHDLLTKKLTNFLSANYLSLFNNGTTALLAALKSLDLTGEVITTPFTFPATIHALTWNNLNPVFCDINKDTLNIDADKIENLITPKTSAILAVHTFGTPCEVYKINEIAKKHNLKIIYDSAHAFGVCFDDKSIANYGDVSVFSFHATKLFHTLEGGAVVTDCKEINRKIEIIRNFGIEKPENIILPGINGKMNEMQAAIGLLVLDLVSKEIEKRRKLFNLYIKKLIKIEGIKLPQIFPNTRSNFQYFVVRINRKKFGMSRDEVFSALNKYNIFPSKYFYPLCSEYKHYKKLKLSYRKNLREAHKASSEVLAMPLYGELGSRNVGKICKILINLKK